MPHVHEKIDFTVEVFIVYRNKVLLRKHDKFKFWLSVGGHIELNEDPNMAAIREVKEEVGLDITLLDNRDYFEDSKEFKELIAPQYLCRMPITNTHEHVTFVYFVTTDTDQLILSEHEKTDEIGWFTKDDLQTMDLRPNVRFYAEKALELLGEK